MSKINEVRAELGEDKIHELMDAYYTSGFSLKELKELFDIPQSFTDGNILQLFPMIELDDGCPLCGGAVSAPRISRGIKGASSTSYYTSQIVCTNCNVTLQEAKQKANRIEWVYKLRRSFSREPKEYNWESYNPDSLIDVAYEVLVEVRGDTDHGYIKPIKEPPLALNFTDCCRALRNADYIEPSAAFDKWLDGFQEQDGELVFYWYKVPFSISVNGYKPIERKTVTVVGNHEFIELGLGEREYWLRTAKGLVMSYLDNQMYAEDYKCEGPKREEFESLLDVMLPVYAPAQITSLIWTAMATAVKQANEGPSYKRNGAWAMGVILNRAKKALSEHWDIRSNMPLLEIDETEFEWHFFDVHVPIQDTWVYRRVPETINGKAEIAQAVAPKGVDAAPAKLIATAHKMALAIGVDDPNYLSREETERFIRANEQKYNSLA